MKTPITAFQQAALATQADRAEIQAQAALDAAKNDNIKTHFAHIDTLLTELRQLPAAFAGVSFKGGVAGDKASLSYSDTYHRENSTTPCLKLSVLEGAAHPIMIEYYEGKGLGEQAERVFPCETQLQALETIGWFLGTVAPERGAEIVPALERAVQATVSQNQLTSGNQGRWAARGSGRPSRV